MPRFGFGSGSSKKINNSDDEVKQWCQLLELDESDKNNKKKIKKAYTALALKMHPDKNNGNSTAEFQEINNAYANLIALNDNK
jgi:DnaJ-class molecular chaperone